jgi:hypothetical protein
MFEVCRQGSVNKIYFIRDDSYLISSDWIPASLLWEIFDSFKYVLHKIK